jgi:hypothetical protein
MMKFIPCFCIAALLAGLSFGCNTISKPPHFKGAAVNPETLQPGDTAVITLQVQDRNTIIDRIEGVVIEDPRIKFLLHDDGQEPDEKANDGIWTLWVDVPIVAPTGEFTLQFTAYRSDGQPVSVRADGGDIVPLQETLPVIIRYEQP